MKWLASCMCCALTLGCASETNGARPDTSRDPRVGADTGGGSDGDSGSTGRGDSGTQAGVEADGGDVSVLVDAGEGADGGPSASLPEAAAPCGTDLGFVGGTVTPDVGDVTSPDAAGVDPEKPGRLAVYREDIKVPISAGEWIAAGYTIVLDTPLELSGTLYAPSRDGGNSITEGRFPLVLLMPGFQASYAMYAELSEHFVSHGFVVVGVDTQGSSTTAQHDKEAFQAVQTISWAIERSSFHAHVDGTKVATTGHSKGGKVSFFTAAIDPRVDLAVGWDPSNAGGPPCFVDATTCDSLPVAPNCGAEMASVTQPEGVMQYTHADSLVFGVPPDSVNPDDKHNALNFYRGAPSPASLVYFAAGHVSFLPQPFLRDDDVIRVVKAVQTAKLLTALYGATGLERYLPGGAYLKAESKVTMVAQK